jgi:hypothetical protein
LGNLGVDLSEVQVTKKIRYKKCLYAL